MPPLPQDVFAIRSRRVVVDGQLRPGAVLVDGERIAAILPRDAVPAGVLVEDLGDLVLSPGLVDTHVHVNEPGRTEWEGFATATRAAAAGGVTTLVDMPLNCVPVTTTADALRIKLEACAPSLWIDVGVWGGVVPGNADELAALARGGVLGCKAFMIDSGIDEFPASSEAVLREAMPRLRDAGIPLLAHAELELGTPIGTVDPHRYRAWLDARPADMEDAAIALLVRLCRETRCPVHVVHLSSAGSLPQIAAAKAEGLPLTVETCPHYLCLRAEDVPDGMTTFKCAPPIRDDDNRERLWQGLVDGTIDFVVSDHSPCTPALKRQGGGDFHAAWGGIASLQLGLASVWTEAHRRGIAPERLAHWLATAPARFAGLADRKGVLAHGRDADLCAWDPGATFEVTEALLCFRHKVSPYLGRTLRGAVLTTWLRGHKVFDAGGFADAPHGRTILHRAEEAPA